MSARSSPSRGAVAVRTRHPKRGLAAWAMAVTSLCLVTLVGAGCRGPAEGPASTSRAPTATFAATPSPTGGAAPPPTARRATAGATVRPSTTIPAPTATITDRVQAQVVGVVDGDTIRVSIDGQVQAVRYIGIDAPEVEQPGRAAEWMGPEAAAMNAELVAGQVVTLERDVSETDRYGRLLRYVYVGDLLVNGELVRLGLARAPSYPPDVGRQDLFRELEAQARAEGRGIWGPPPTPAVGRTEAPTPEPSTREGCDPAYPDVCIPPPPPDLDCSDIAYRDFRVLPPDPHHFDGGQDGIGCESQDRE